MIEEHPDPTAELHAHMANLLRTLVTAAAAVAERRAQRNQREQADARARGEAESQALNARIAAERHAAELVWRVAYRDAWWERADAQAMARVVEAAGSWAGSDSRAADALDHVADQLARRYGIDLAELYRRGAHAGELAEALAEHAPNDVTKQAGGAKPAHAGAVTQPIRDRWEEEVMAALEPSLATKILAAEGWPRLQASLDQLSEDGEAVSARLAGAVGRRELESALDPAITIAWRLKNPAGAGPDRHTGRSSAQAEKRASWPGRASDKAETRDQRAAKERLNIQLHRDEHRPGIDRGTDC